VLGLRIEVGDRLGHDARAGGKNEVVVAESLAAREMDGAGRLVDLLDRPDDQADPLVEE